MLKTDLKEKARSQIQAREREARRLNSLSIGSQSVGGEVGDETRIDGVDGVIVGRGEA
jgi:hypothetical protein